jgi:hypothetical protein
VEWAIKRALPLVEQLAGGVSPVAGASLPVIEPPAIGPTGELIDTSIENPSDPQNNVLHEDNAGIGVAAGKPKAAPTTADLVKPEAPSATPDMVFEAVGVSKQGQRVEAPQTQANPARAADGGGTSEMSFATPLEVPKKGPADAANALAQSEEAEDNSAPLPAVVRSFQTTGGSGLQVTLFAAGTDGPGYDGVVIERVTGKKLAAAKQAVTKPPAAPTPPATAAPKPAVTTSAPVPPNATTAGRPEPPPAATTPAKPAPTLQPVVPATTPAPTPSPAPKPSAAPVPSATAPTEAPKPAP